MAISPDGKRVYTAHRTADSVSVIDVASQKVIKEISVGAGPVGVALGALGKKLYVANRLADTVTVVDTTTFAAVREIKVANQPYDLLAGKGDMLVCRCVRMDL